MELAVAMAGGAGAMLGGFFGGLLAYVAAMKRLRSETTQWQQDALVRGLGFLTGGTQNRSVGIGVIEALIRGSNVPQAIRPSVDRVLWTQLVYVTYEGDIRRKHENENARRLIKLVEQAPDKSGLPDYAQKIDEIRRLVDEAA
jgi:hypothetical protein